MVVGFCYLFFSYRIRVWILSHICICSINTATCTDAFVAILIFKCIWIYISLALLNAHDDYNPNLHPVVIIPKYYPIVGLNCNVDSLLHFSSERIIDKICVVKSVSDFSYFEDNVFRRFDQAYCWVDMLQHCHQKVAFVLITRRRLDPDSKVHGAKMGPTWVLSAPDGPMLAP